MTAVGVPVGGSGVAVAAGEVGEGAAAGTVAAEGRAVAGAEVGVGSGPDVHAASIESAEADIRSRTAGRNVWRTK